jgi:threonyl-tRNA synthetase
VIIPITDKQMDFARQVRQRLFAAGLRVELDDNRDRMQGKIRRAQLQKIPYMLIIGAREQDAEAVAVRTRAGEDLGAMPLEAFLARALEEVRTRAS